MLFPIINSGGIFITDELDVPDTRDDMNINKEKPTLRDILYKIKSGENFESKLVTDEQKKYLLEKVDTVSIFKGDTFFRQSLFNICIYIILVYCNSFIDIL